MTWVIQSGETRAYKKRGSLGLPPRLLSCNAGTALQVQRGTSGSNLGLKHGMRIISIYIWQ